MRNKDHKWLKFVGNSAALFSTCGKRQYFAVIVDHKGHILGTGYNGGPSGAKHCEDGGCPRFIERTTPFSDYDNCIAVHAEANAILHSDYSARLHGSTLYVNGPPCYSCAKLIMNSGISTLVCYRDDRHTSWDDVAQKLIVAGVQVYTYVEQSVDIRLRSLIRMEQHG